MMRMPSRSGMIPSGLRTRHCLAGPPLPCKPNRLAVPATVHNTPVPPHVGDEVTVKVAELVDLLDDDVHDGRVATAAAKTTAVKAGRGSLGLRPGSPRTAE